MTTRYPSPILIRLFLIALTLLPIPFAQANQSAQEMKRDIVSESDASHRLTFKNEFDKLGRLKRQILIFRKPGSSPLNIEHGLDLPTFLNPDEYADDVARYGRDAYALRMLSIGAETGVIRDIPTNLKGDKFREWMRSQTTIVENSMCSNAAVKTEIMSFLRGAAKQPPPPKEQAPGSPIDPSRRRKKSPTMT